VLAIGVQACHRAVQVKNAAPEIFGFGPVELLSTEQAQLGLWLVDLDTDPVDVVVAWVDAAGKATPIVEDVGGHGHLALSSLPTPPGKPHVLLWNVKGIDPKAKISLRMTPDDTHGGVGTTRNSPVFALEDGLPTTNASK